MSRAFVPAHEVGKLESFAGLLPTLGEAAKTDARGVKLGRTAGILETAKQEARAEGYALGLEEGRAKGHEEGLQAGFDEAVNREMAIRGVAIERFVADLNQVSESVVNAVYEWFGQSEQFIASLSLLIASRVVARELTTTEDVTLQIVKEALQEVTHAESARVRVNPFAMPSLAEQKESLLALSPSLKDVQIVDDPAILGGCVVESAGGVIDSTVETRILSILAEVREHYAADREEPEKPKKARSRTKAAEKEAA